MCTSKYIAAATAIFIILIAIYAQAKRVPPPKVTAIISKGIMYKASYNFETSGARKHIVEIWDESGKTKLREVTVYATQPDKGMEADAQDDFIYQLKKDGNKLIVTSEKGTTFSVNLSTYAVKRVLIDR